MRRLLILTAILALGGIQQTHARLFWQTYGSIDEHPGGCGCAWNSNQDYFVPRTCDAGRYGLFGPCKTSCTDSPACKYQHPLHPGYCTVYGPCHYCWRNHVYRCYCGCRGIHPYKCNGVCAHWCGPLRYGCGGHCCRQRRCGGCYGGLAGSCPCEYPGAIPFYQPSPNVESPGFEILGTVPVQGDELLASIGVNLEQPTSTLEEPASSNVNTEDSEAPLPVFGLPQ